MRESFLARVLTCCFGHVWPRVGSVAQCEGSGAGSLAAELEPSALPAAAGASAIALMNTDTVRAVAAELGLVTGVEIVAVGEAKSTADAVTYQKRGRADRVDRMGRVGRVCRACRVARM